MVLRDTTGHVVVELLPGKVVDLVSSLSLAGEGGSVPESLGL